MIESLYVIGRVIINLDDENLLEPKIEYYYYEDWRKHPKDSDYKHIDIDRLHKIMYKNFPCEYKSELLNGIKMQFSRFLMIFRLFDSPSIINRYKESEIKYLNGMPIPTLPISLYTETLIHGVIAMNDLSNVYGAFTHLFIRYRNQLERTNFHREGVNNIRAIYLLYSFLKNNKIKIYELDIDSLKFEDFYLIFYYINLINYDVDAGERKIDELEPRGELLLQKAREKYSNKRDMMSQKEK